MYLNNDGGVLEPPGPLCVVCGTIADYEYEDIPYCWKHLPED